MRDILKINSTRHKNLLHMKDVLKMNSTLMKRGLVYELLSKLKYYVNQL